MRRSPRSEKRASRPALCAHARSTGPAGKQWGPLAPYCAAARQLARPRGRRGCAPRTCYLRRRGKLGGLCCGRSPAASAMPSTAAMSADSPSSSCPAATNHETAPNGSKETALGPTSRWRCHLSSGYE
eukprot:scaffold47449_cov110-Phaeocystis_antarctica.AAC.8